MKQTWMPVSSAPSPRCAALRARVLRAFDRGRLHIAAMVVGLGVGMAGLPGCADGPSVANVLPGTPTDQVAVAVSLRFENVRTFLDANGNESGNEWSQIAPILTKYHQTGNVYGVEYRAEPIAKSNAPPGMRVHDYTVRMVVANMSRLAAMHDEISATRGRTIGGQRIDFAAKNVEVMYSTPYVKPELEMSFFGRGDPGTTVSLFEPGMTTPRVQTIGSAGIWTIRLRVDPRIEHIYGYSTGADGQESYFRIHVLSRTHEALNRESFMQLRFSGN